MIAIGSDFIDQETGEKIIPLYFRHPSTGVISTKLVTIGAGQKVADKTVPVLLA